MMNDLSDNKYIKSHLNAPTAYNLNRLLFGEVAAKKAVSREEFTLAIHDLLDSVGFGLYLEGYKYLADITEHYLLSDGYSFESAVKDISHTYRTTDSRVIDNIRTSVDENRMFKNVAAKLLHLDFSSISIDSVSDVVEILGAIFIRYFNFYLK